MTSKLKLFVKNGIHKAISAMLSAVLLLLICPPWPALAAVSSEAEDRQLFEQLQQGKRVDAGRTYQTAEKPTVYLTFDDGPSKLTPEVLDILHREQVKATFFVLGEQVEARPELVKRMVKEGHAVGNHSYNHVYSELYAGFGNFWLQLQKAEEAIAKAAGVRPQLVRAPGGTFGNFDAFYFYYLEQAGYEVHDWNIDSEDARRAGMTAEDIYGTVAKGPFRKEMVVLMHDSGGHGETVKALPRIIKLFKEKGYEFAPLTTEVKPIQFSSGKPKWPRQVAVESYQRQLAMVQEQTEKRKGWAKGNEETQKGDAMQPSEGEKDKAEERKPAVAQLKLQFGDKSLLLEQNRFLLGEQSVQVPLRQLTEMLGGKVEWRDEARTAAVRFGLYQAEYDLGRRELRVTRPAAGFLGFGLGLHFGGETKRLTLPEMDVREGTLYVPLQKTLELLGHQVMSFEKGIAGEEAHVRMALHSSFGVNWSRGAEAPVVPKDSGYVMNRAAESFTAAGF
ncbi:polysaccharide deacetylase family protein [Paenibacillus sp. GD4]|uniref:polysaccharide deacetylase n=1 Tax=Paenibacillus sp. GD4 TaxID=3068890 RepID=UPI0027963F23|nr:polysaccharide deacetylase [Paenibacillus sp. GD4]MDQ1911607.1 polysaccharide deacetylase family protein [Paenibacillus sp. GD4]